MASQTTPAEAEMVKGEHNPFVNQMLAVAQTLADERDDVQRRIGANRDILRNMGAMGFLSAEQESAIVEFYPVRERKGKNSGNGTGETFAAKEVAKNAAKNS